MKNNNYLSLRAFLTGSVAPLGLTAVNSSIFAKKSHALSQTETGIPKVYFSSEITSLKLLELYSKVSQNITGKVGIKLHTGESGAPYLPPRELIVALQSSIPNSSIIECNVLYPSPRQTTEGHKKLLKDNGWTFCPVDIMDEDGEIALPIPDMNMFFEEQWGNPGADIPFTSGNHLREVLVGKNLLNYDSLVVYTHFKGHTMGGYGGSLKNVAIGCASPAGKRQQHGDGWVGGNLFQEHMVEAGKGIISHFGSNIVYINLLMNMSVDCDCAGMSAAQPKCPDIGILVSTDLVAVEQASVDMVYALPDEQKRDIVDRIESRSGLRQLEFMKILGMGDGQYELIKV